LFLCAGSSQLLSLEDLFFLRWICAPVLKQSSSAAAPMVLQLTHSPVFIFGLSFGFATEYRTQSQILVAPVDLAAPATSTLALTTCDS
jgi:hypothetical protein